MISPVSELLLNTKNKPLDDKMVRKAIAFAMNRQFIIDNIWFGYGKPATGPMSSNFAPSGLYTDDVTIYEVGDEGVEMANKILDEAGYKKNADGVRFELMHDSLPYGQEWTRFGEYVQQQLGKIGIKVTIRQEDVARWLKRTYTDHDFDTTANYLYNLSDPVVGVHRAVHSSTIKPGTVFTNGSYWSDPKVDELLNKAKVEPDRGQAQRALRRGAEVRRRGDPHHLGPRDELPHRDQQPVRGRHRLGAGGVLELRPGLHEVGKQACRAGPSSRGRCLRVDVQ